MSTLKVNKIRDTSGSADAIVLDPSGGVKMSGICTATTFDGSATSLTQIPAANLVGVCTAGLTRTGGFGKFASYAIIADQKAASTNHGGTFTSGDWRTRDLNTELADADGIVSISSNQFTLQAGSYLIKAAAPAYRVNRHLIRLYNITDSSVAEEGYGSYSHANDNSLTHTFLSAQITITGAKVFEIQHRCQATEANVGFGVNMEDTNNTNDVYTIVEIYKEA